MRKEGNNRMKIKKDLFLFKKAFSSFRKAWPGPSGSLSTLQYYEPIIYTMASETGNMKVTSTSVMSYHYTIYHYISP